MPFNAVGAGFWALARAHIKCTLPVTYSHIEPVESVDGMVQSIGRSHPGFTRTCLRIPHLSDTAPVSFSAGATQLIPPPIPITSPMRQFVHPELRLKTSPTSNGNLEVSFFSKSYSGEPWTGVYIVVSENHPGDHQRFIGGLCHVESRLSCEELPLAGLRRAVARCARSDLILAGTPGPGLRIHPRYLQVFGNGIHCCRALRPVPES